jgi:RNA polymerase sigma-70 factor (ECF subfamily)
LEDEEIVRMYWDRDENAITVTDVKYGKLCRSIACNILGNSEDAKECVNDAYLNLWNSIPPQRPQILSSYLAKLVRNISFNMYKKNRAQKRGGGQLPLILEEIQELSGEATPENELEKSEITEILNDFLEELAPEKRIMFVRRYWYADSVKDIAKAMSLTENNVSVTLNRLRSRLRDYLEERGVEL